MSISMEDAKAGRDAYKGGFCEHLDLHKEREPRGAATGDYVCKVCYKTFINKAEAYEERINFLVGHHIEKLKLSGMQDPPFIRGDFDLSQTIRLPNFTDDHTLADGVVKIMERNGYVFKNEAGTVSFKKAEVDHFGESKTTRKPLAICEAALRALGFIA